MTMVNTGKPSGACGVCRERRIKCDETKPACLKCSRSGRTCSGYHLGLKLRDQTQKTILKAKLGKPRVRHQKSLNSQQKSKQSPRTSPRVSSEGASPEQEKDTVRSSNSPHSTHSDDPSGSHVATKKGGRRSSSSSVTSQQQQQLWSSEWQVAQDDAIDPRLWQTIDTPIVEQARCYFLSSYVIYSPKSPAEGMFTFIPSLLSTDSTGKEHFEDLFSAVAIAAFATRPNAGRAATAATMYYTRGLTRLRQALGDKAHAKSDTALASTILLGFYEGIVDEGVGIVAYNPHFKGALTLLRMRGEEQFSTLHGTEMFDFVMQVLMRQFELSLSCSEEDLCRWSIQAGMRPKAQRPHLTAMFVGNLRLKAGRLLQKEERDAKTIQEATEIMVTAQKFERLVTQRFEAEDTDLLSERIVPSQSSADETRQSPRLYSDWWSATRLLNKYAFRLLLCHLIADVSDWLDGAGSTRSTSQSQGSGLKAAAIAHIDIESIMSTIPYLCTWKEGRARGASSPCGRNDAQSTQGITHLLVIWPLYLTGHSRFATSTQKEYIQQNLSLMGENLGVKHASAVSKYLKMLETGKGSHACLMSS